MRKNASKNYGPAFRTVVPLILSSSSDEMSDNAKVSDKMSDKVSDKVSDNAKMSDKVSDKNPQDALLAYLRGAGEATAAEASIIINRSVQTTRRLLARLVAEGTVITSGANRNRKYQIKG